MTPTPNVFLLVREGPPSCRSARSPLDPPQVRFLLPDSPEANLHIYRTITTFLASYITGDLHIAGWIIFATAVFFAINVLRDFKPLFKFIWHCLLKPIGTADQRTQLETVQLSSFDCTCTPITNIYRISSTKAKLKFTTPPVMVS